MKNTNALARSHWIWSKFDELNARHFGGRLVRPLEILRSSSTALVAMTVNKVVSGVAIRMIWIDGEALDGDPAAAGDSLLHEMIHYELAEEADGDPDQGHGSRFIARADQIGRALGLAPCLHPHWTAEQTRTIARVWPQVQRAAAKLQE